MPVQEPNVDPGTDQTHPDKYRSAAKRAAWYDGDDEPGSYNPFRKFRPRRFNTLSEAEQGQDPITRTQSDNVRPRSSATQANEMRGGIKEHAQTLPARTTKTTQNFNEATDYDLPRSASPGIEEVPKEAEPTEKDVASSEEQAKDSTSSNTIVPTTDHNEIGPRRRKPLDRFKGILHKDSVDELDDDGKSKPKFTPMSQVRATLFVVLLPCAGNF